MFAITLWSMWMANSLVCRKSITTHPHFHNKKTWNLEHKNDWGFLWTRVTKTSHASIKNSPNSQYLLFISVQDWDSRENPLTSPRFCEAAEMILPQVLSRWINCQLDWSCDATLEHLTEWRGYFRLEMGPEWFSMSRFTPHSLSLEMFFWRLNRGLVGKFLY